MDRELENLRRVAASGSLEDVINHARARLRAGQITEQEYNSIQIRAKFRAARADSNIASDHWAKYFTEPQFWGPKEEILHKNEENFNQSEWESDSLDDPETLIVLDFNGIVPIARHELFDLREAHRLAEQVATGYVENYLSGLDHEHLSVGERYYEDYDIRGFIPIVEHTILRHLTPPLSKDTSGMTHSYWNVWIRAVSFQ